MSLVEGLIQCIDNLKQWCDSIPLADNISMLAFEVPESRALFRTEGDEGIASTALWKRVARESRE